MSAAKPNMRHLSLNERHSRIARRHIPRPRPAWNSRVSPRLNDCDGFVGWSAPLPTKQRISRGTMVGGKLPTLRHLNGWATHLSGRGYEAVQHVGRPSVAPCHTFSQPPFIFQGDSHNITKGEHHALYIDLCRRTHRTCRMRLIGWLSPGCRYPASARCDLSVGCSFGTYPSDWRRQPNQSSEVPE